MFKIIPGNRLSNIISWLPLLVIFSLTIIQYQLVHLDKVLHTSLLHSQANPCHQLVYTQVYLWVASFVYLPYALSWKYPLWCYHLVAYKYTSFDLNTRKLVYIYHLRIFRCIALLWTVIMITMKQGFTFSFHILLIYILLLSHLSILFDILQFYWKVMMDDGSLWYLHNWIIFKKSKITKPPSIPVSSVSNAASISYS